MIIVRNGEELELQAFYYYMGQISKFVPPGSQRVGLTNSSGVVTATAMLTPENNTVVVVMNEQDVAVTLSLIDMEFGHANTTLLPHSIVTLVY
jgi:glucosylceramidase